MGFFNILGKIVGAVAEAFLDQCNDTLKKSTGVDMKKEFKPYVDNYKDAKKQREDFINTKEDFIREYGEEAYKEELKYYTEGVKDTVYDIHDMGIEITEATKDSYRDKVYNLSDSKLLNVYKRRHNFSEWQKNIIEEEFRSRGLHV